MAADDNYAADGNNKAFAPSRRKPASDFRKAFNRGDIPALIEESRSGRRLIWVSDMESLNYEYFVPLFFSGLQEKSDPYRFVAYEGTFELLETLPGSCNILNSLHLIGNV